MRFRAAGEQQRSHAHRDPGTDRLDVRLDELHRVVDRETGIHRAAGRVDVQVDVLVRVLGLQMQKLSDDQVRDLVIDGCPEEDDALGEQARINVKGALASRGLLNHHRDQRAHRLTTSQAPPKTLAGSAGHDTETAGDALIVSRPTSTP
jgi:hypothetical protein